MLAGIINNQSRQNVRYRTKSAFCTGGIMDRRQKKTRDAIFRAFSTLLTDKRYENITVQEIIDEADVGRSTFYSHFETKDMLLKVMCSDIFDHIFEGNICGYSSQDRALEAELSHVLWHLNEHRCDIRGLFISDSSEVFTRYLSEYLEQLFSMYLDDLNIDTPRDFLLNHLVGSFIGTIKWWIRKDMELPPETVAKYFIEVTETH